MLCEGRLNLTGAQEGGCVWLITHNLHAPLRKVELSDETCITPFAVDTDPIHFREPVLVQQGLEQHPYERNASDKPIVFALPEEGAIFWRVELNNAAHLVALVPPLRVRVFPGLARDKSKYSAMSHLFRFEVIGIVGFNAQSAPAHLFKRKGVAVADAIVATKLDKGAGEVLLMH